ncbi:hypothetical protein K0M31_018587 [Melipona bicolor]|uniref:Uncharacterized protein n=1 Tax=Melipona bicolor TaxID=60889 RepID=A0AA40G3L6_9HYME|nr:hypothetical protein K0M31_018587 [Melipona bicolor]
MPEQRKLRITLLCHILMACSGSNIIALSRIPTFSLHSVPCEMSAGLIAATDVTSEFMPHSRVTQQVLKSCRDVTSIKDVVDRDARGTIRFFGFLNHEITEPEGNSIVIHHCTDIFSHMVGYLTDSEKDS